MTIALNHKPSQLITLLIIIVPLLINACGFHLRGSVDFNFSSIQIQSEAADHVAQEVERILLAEGVQIASSTEQAQAVLFLRNEKTDKRVLTVSSISGKLEEVELNFRVTMEVRQPDDTVLLSEQVISLLRDYSFDDQAVLAMAAEEEVLREEMFRDVVAQIIRRLQVIKVIHPA